MDTEIRKENKIQTGCDRFTKPEEILALSKYLKKNRELVDEHTELGKDNLEVSGRRYGSIKEINSLSDKLEVLNKGGKEVSKLVSEKEWIASNKNIDKLEGKRLDINIGKDPSLGNNLEDIEPGTKDIESLSKFKEILSPKEDNTLSEQVSPIINSKDKLKTLESEIEKIKNSKSSETLAEKEIKSSSASELIGSTHSPSSLEKGVTRIEGKDTKITSLDGDLEKVENKLNDPKELSGTIDKVLGKQTETALETDLEKITGKSEDPSLEGKRENIIGGEESGDSLSSFLDKVSNTKDETTSLSGIRENINGETGDAELGKELQKLNESGKKEVSLSSEKDSILGSIKDTSLGTDASKIVGSISDTSLDSILENIEGTTNIDVPLGTDLENIVGTNKDTSLGTELEKVVGKDKDVSLGTEKPKIIGTTNIDVSLGTERPDIIGTTNIDVPLGTDVEKIENPQDLDSLKANLIDIEPKPSDIELGSEPSEKVENYTESDNNISGTLEKLGAGNSDTLDTTVSDKFKTESIKLDPGNGNDSITNLDGERPNIIGTTNIDVSLGTERPDIIGTTNIDVPLGTERENIIGTTNIDVPLGTEREDIIGTTNIDVPLGTEVENLLGEDKESPLSDYVSKIDPGEDPSLEGNVEKVQGDSNDPSSLSTKLEPVDNYVESNNPLSTDLENISQSTTSGTNPDEATLSTDLEDIIGGDKESPLSTFLDDVIGSDKDSPLSDKLENVIGEDKESPLSTFLDDVIDTDKHTINPGDETNKATDSGLSTTLIDATKDDTSKLNTNGEADHGQFENISDGQLYDTRLGVKDIDKETPIDSLSSTLVDASKDDTSKTNLGGNFKRDSETDTTRDDFTHTGFQDKLDKSYEKVDKATNGTLDEDFLKDKVNSYSPEDVKTGLENKDKPRLDTGKDKSEEELLETITSRNVDEAVRPKVISPANDEEKELEKVFNSRDNLDSYYDNLLHFADNKNLDTGWASKVKTLMSRYLSGGELTQDKVEQFESELFGTIIRDQGTVQMAKYKLNVSWSNALSASTYLRWLAEKSVSWIPGKSGTWALGSKPGDTTTNIREEALDTVLMALVAARRVSEVASKSNRDRLPGKDSGVIQNLAQSGDVVLAGKRALSSIISSVKKSASSSSMVDTEAPLNRPQKKTPTEGWEYGNNRINTSIHDTKHSNVTDTSITTSVAKTSFFKKVINAAKAALGKGLLGYIPETPYTFHENYISSWGMTTTLQELCGSYPSDIKSVEDLKDTLKNSLFSTTVDKFSTSNANIAKGGRVYTLDDNSFWEIVFDPFVGYENAYYSYLPSIDEINVWNMVHYGVNTDYNKWIPFTSFDLSKSKMNSKSLGLYDGEINYPISMEYTNELRLTIADDQYKSWRTYFERCADASVYSSEPHDQGYYGYSNGNYTPVKLRALTSIDKSFICPALYKNVTFRCIIYSLTPQLETISKYDLLVVLRDFSEERSGDIDPGGSDLNLTFSIVGENPREAISVGKIGSMKSIFSKASNEAKKERESFNTKSILNKTSSLPKIKNIL
jgi:hypothetical protein